MFNKYLTADDFESMVYELAKENPDMSLGQCAITLYRTQEEQNKIRADKRQQEINELHASIFALKTRGIK
jgi:hypothetical protein